MEVPAEQLEKTLVWVDSIPLSRPKKNLHRDFSDGVLMAEILKQFYPKLVELHNYSAASALDRKQTNWTLLNNKVLKKIGMPLQISEIEAVASAQPGAIERILTQLHKKIMDAFSEQQQQQQQQQQQSSVPGRSHTPRSHLDSPSRIPSPSGKGLSEGASARLKEIEGKYEKMLHEKEETNKELRDTIEILEAKISKLEQLVRIKDAKINALNSKIQGNR